MRFRCLVIGCNFYCWFFGEIFDLCIVLGDDMVFIFVMILYFVDLFDLKNEVFKYVFVEVLFFGEFSY